MQNSAFNMHLARDTQKSRFYLMFNGTKEGLHNPRQSASQWLNSYSMNHKIRSHRNSEHIGSNGTPFRFPDGLFPPLPMHSSDSPLNNPLPDHPQIAHGKQYSQLRRVLGKPSEAKLGKAKLALENSERYSDRECHQGQQDKKPARVGRQ
jgi:hypothetical protein